MIIESILRISVIFVFVCLNLKKSKYFFLLTEYGQGLCDITDRSCPIVTQIKTRKNITKATHQILA